MLGIRAASIVQWAKRGATVSQYISLILVLHEHDYSMTPDNEAGENDRWGYTYMRE